MTPPVLLPNSKYTVEVSWPCLSVPQRKQCVVAKLFWQVCPFYTWGRWRGEGRTRVQPGWVAWWWWGFIGEQCKQVRRKSVRTGKGESEEMTMRVMDGHDCEGGFVGGWLAGWVDERMFHWLAEFKAGRLTGCTADWLDFWPTGCTVGWLADRALDVRKGWLAVSVDG